MVYDKTFRYPTPVESPGFLLWQVTNYWQRMIKQRLKPFQLTHTQFVLLANMYWCQQNEIKLSQITLAMRIKLDPMNVSSVLRTLEEKKLIRRKASFGDARAIALELTKQGEKLIVEAIPVVEEFDASFFQMSNKDLSAFNQQLIALME